MNVSSPDSNGQCKIDADISIKNPLLESVALFKTNYLLFNDKNALICKGSNESETSVEPGESEDISFFGSVNQEQLRHSKDLTLNVTTRLFKRNVFKFGPFKVNDKEGLSVHTGDFNFDGTNEDIVFSIYRTEVDEEGDICLEIMCSINNRSDKAIEECKVVSQINDQKGIQIDYTADSDKLRRHSMNGFLTSFFGLKAKRVRNSSIEIEISFFCEVYSEDMKNTVGLRLEHG